MTLSDECARPGAFQKWRRGSAQASHGRLRVGGTAFVIIICMRNQQTTQSEGHMTVSGKLLGILAFLAVAIVGEPASAQVGVPRSAPVAGKEAAVENPEVADVPL